MQAASQNQSSRDSYPINYFLIESTFAFAESTTTLAESTFALAESRDFKESAALIESAAEVSVLPVPQAAKAPSTHTNNNFFIFECFVVSEFIVNAAKT